MNEIKSELLVIGFNCPEEEITEALGLQPTKTLRKGDIRRADPKGVDPPALHAENIWVFSFNFPLTSSVEDHIKGTLDFLDPHREGILDVTNKYEVELSVYGFSHDEGRLAFHLENTILQRLASLNISLDLDVYPIDED